MSNQLAPLFVIIPFIACLCLIVITIFGGVFWYAHRQGQVAEEVWASAAEQLGLTFTSEPGSVTIAGRLEGVEVHVGMQHVRKLVVRPESAYGHTIPWMVVEATPPRPPRFETRPPNTKAKAKGAPANMAPQPVGDPALDARYTFFFPNGLTPADVSASARQAMATAEEPVYVVDGNVRWLRAGTEKDVDKLIRVLRSCARVAAAF